MPHIVIIGTLDTKLEEILYLRSQVKEALEQCHAPVKKITLIDCGRKPSPNNPLIDIRQQDLIDPSHRSSQQDGRRDRLESMPRGEVVKFMAECTTTCVKELWAGGPENDRTPHGIISAGGSGGTSLVATVMRALPIGVPKFIVSTIASGDTGPIVGETDISVMYSVVDIAGSNELLRSVLGNAAGAITGMATVYEKTCRMSSRLGHVTPGQPVKKRIGVTMFGVTTPCVDAIRKHLEENYSAEVFVFHATGHGGKAMERLVDEGRLDAVVDMTTTEICDYLFEGNMSAGPRRLEAALKRGIPTIISLGATDMVNFGPKNSVPERYRSRRLFEHNPVVTLMRTSKEECRAIGNFIADKIRTNAQPGSPLELHFPTGGVSMLATPGGAFEDSEADEELRETIKRGLKGCSVKIVEDARDINDKGFAIEVAESVVRLMNFQG